MLNDFNFDFEDQHNVFFPSDNTRVTSINRKIDTSKLPKDISISVGKYRMTVGKPTGTVPNVFGQHQDFVMFLDAKGNFQQKAYTVDQVKYDVTKDKLYIDIDVKENPIPLFVLWGAVAAVVMVVGAITADSILEDISSLTEDAVVKPVTELGKQPIVWAIVAIFLIPVVATLFKRVKGS